MTDIDIAAAKREAAPFLLEIISIVRPQLVLLTGVSLSVFVERFCSEEHNSIPRIRDEKIKHVVFEAANVLLRGSNSEALVVQVAHASQFSWTYEKYSVVEPSSNNFPREIKNMITAEDSKYTWASSPREIQKS